MSTEIKRYDLKYVGVAPIILRAKGFLARVKIGETISLLKEPFDDLKGRDEWEVVKVKKSKLGDEQ